MHALSMIFSQLAAHKQCVHDVTADGNCLFKAAYYVAHGNGNKHTELHAAVVEQVKKSKLNVCTKITKPLMLS